jgi:hypothetical protein
MACGGSLLWCGRRPGEGGKEAEEAVSTAGSPRRRHARERERGRESAHAQARVRECVYTSKETLGLAKKLHIQRKGAALWILGRGPPDSISIGLQNLGRKKSNGGGESRGGGVERLLSRRVRETFLATVVGRE